MPLRFTLRQLEYFIAVAESGSVALASKKVNVSSPSISAAITQMEEEFRLQLFVRKHAQGLSLTRGGASFLDQARRVVAEADRLNRLVNDITGKVLGELSVGCLVTMAQLILPQLRRSFVDVHPQVEFRQFEQTQTLLFQGIRAAKLDVALTYDLEIPADLEFLPLVSLPPYALVAARHELAGAEHVTPRELVRHPMVLLDLPSSSQYFLSFFDRLKDKPYIVERTGDMAVMQSMVANGFGYSLANIRPISDIAPDGKRLAYVPVTGGPRAMRLGLLLSDATRSSLTVRRFVEHCREMIAPGSIPGLRPLPARRTKEQSDG